MDVEDAAVVARAAVVDVLDARELSYAVGVWGLEAVYLGPVAWLLVSYPEHLGVPVVWVYDVAGGLEEGFPADPFLHPPALVDGSAVRPDEAGPDGGVVPVHGNPAATVEAAYAGARDIIWVDGRSFDGFLYGGVGGLGPYLGPLLGPPLLWCEDAILPEAVG